MHAQLPVLALPRLANFYGTDDYGDKFVLGALGTPSNGYAAAPAGFPKHDMDFTGAPTRARYALSVRRALRCCARGAPRASTAVCGGGRR